MNPSGPGREFVLTVSCPERRGIVHALTGVVLEHQLTIADSQQFADTTSGQFHLRMHLVREGDALSVDELRAAMEGPRATYDMDVQVHDAAQRARLLVMVSKAPHCLRDLLFRVQSGQLNAEIGAVVSNHPDLEDIVRWHGVPFHHVPVSASTKDAAETQMLRIIGEQRLDTVVLARYMQILSPAVCRQMAGQVINIHHSLLPSFKGAGPYRQAHERGVKVIGATAHYVTADLDEGPIIEQDFRRVDHRMSPAQLATAGEELEAMALARAVRWHVEHRVVLRGRRTIVFD
ncbi:formyltetrahydrofolate deformylase [Leekyejoonella antrihumi]|uniref:Formyltetrahydrofolate deformylase n=1 Tax=Leekyejoonella antrihumi TaxID=1660198 RepID=A0A563DZ53_9MICO|nr:formyltetrahydrofolate deformylase [Leekyejoonella antrihumi]TWP35538.1 formyltetrahydrofolate deformylase [Leekyejoonella antrihumi]